MIDVTLGYSKGRVPVLGRAMLHEWPGNDNKVAVHYTVKKVTPDLVDNEDKLRDFFYNLWLEKEKNLDYFYEHGYFPDDHVGRPVHFPTGRVIVVQLLWLIGLAFHLWLWMGPLACFVGRQILSFLL